jgi:hypothetical protein
MTSQSGEAYLTKLSNVPFPLFTAYSYHFQNSAVQFCGKKPPPLADRFQKYF